MAARQVVQERLAVEASRLPAAASKPVILSPLSSTSRLLKIGVSSKTLSQMDLTLLAKWTIRPRLMSIPGVANVAIWGQRDRQYQVLVDPDRLRLNAVTLDTVVKAVTDASVVSGGGFVDMPNQRIAVRHSRGDRGPRGPRQDDRGLPQRGPAAPGRRRRDQGRLPAPDRRRRDQRRRGPAPDRREAADGQHPASDQGSREGPRGAEAGPQGRGHRPDHLPPRGFHRAVAGQPLARP